MSGYYDGGYPMLAHPKEPLPSIGAMNCRMTRTWMQDREDELRRRSSWTRRSASLQIG